MRINCFNNRSNVPNITIGLHSINLNELYTNLEWSYNTKVCHVPRVFLTHLTVSMTLGHGEHVQCSSCISDSRDNIDDIGTP